MEFVAPASSTCKIVDKFGKVGEYTNQGAIPGGCLLAHLRHLAYHSSGDKDQYNCIAYKGLIVTYQNGCKIGFGAVLTAVLSVSAPVDAGLSLFVGTVGFDEEANLDSAPAFGLRWGKGTSLFGGETSLLISRPPRQIADSEETATAIFYEGRFLINIPAGQLNPFVGVGLGAVTVDLDRSSHGHFSGHADSLVFGNRFTDQYLDQLSRWVAIWALRTPGPAPVPRVLSQRRGEERGRG